MASFNLQPDCYLSVTPEGAYHCVSSPAKNPAQKLLKWILEQKRSPLLCEQLFEQLAVDGLDVSETKEVLYHAQSLRWVEALEKQSAAHEGALEDILPDILPTLSSEGKVLLADAQGFYICACGFNHESAEQLSALSADLASTHERHASLLQQNLGLGFNAWGVIDAAGNSQIGFWPMFIGSHRFVLVVAGLPRLNQANLTKTISVLSVRYG
jgi:hypothetical protein